jgi:ABC-type multidrug transport system ATPase subunit
MRNDTWLEMLGDELRVLGMAPARSVEVVVETESFLLDTGEEAFAHFGSPTDYAAVLCQELTDSIARTTPFDGGAPLIEADGLCRSFRSRRVLTGVSLCLRPGQLVALTGPNGSGKTTLLRIVAGLDRPDAGHVRRRGRIGYTPQAGGVDPTLRPDEHFVVFGGAVGMGSHEAVRRGRLLAGELCWEVDRSTPVAGKLSGGTQRKLCITTALLTEPEILLLDEPYQGMDAESTRRFWDLLGGYCEAGGAAVVSTHQTDALGRAHAVLELDGARR